MHKVGLVLLLLAGEAFANGRPEAVSSIEFRQTRETDIVAGLTFGLVVSSDRGATWHWMCEKAVGYGGMFDPDYAFSRSGAIFATTFTGLKVMRDGCTFDAAATGGRFVSTDELDRDGALYAGVADPAVNEIDRSSDDGQTFAPLSMPGQPNDWWDTLQIAPSNTSRLYLTGYRFVARPSCNASFVGQGSAGCGGTYKYFLNYKSDDAGATWTAFEQGAMVTSESSAIQIVGIDKANPDIVYARVTYETGVVGDAIYRSVDAGHIWTRIFAKPNSIAFLARANGDLVAGTPQLGAFVSHDSGATWTALEGSPHPNCLVENSAGEVWACTVASTSQGIPTADGFGIMKTTDLVTWTGVLKFQDIAAPVACAAGTVQHDVCAVQTWCGVKRQLGITSNAIDCSTPIPPVATPDAGAPVTPPPTASGGCCDAGAPRSALLLALAVGALLSWPRARPRPRRDRRARRER